MQYAYLRSHSLASVTVSGASEGRRRKACKRTSLLTDATMPITPITAAVMRTAPTAVKSVNDTTAEKVTAMMMVGHSTS